MARRDLLDMPVRELLERLLNARTTPDTDWVNVRTEQLPWRHLVAAAERGEVVLSRVGRKLMMRRADLDRWLEAQRIGSQSAPPKPVSEAKPANDVTHLLQKLGLGTEGNRS